MTGKVANRLKRILLMVPYVLNERGGSITQLCKKFSISRSELMSDMHLLWICGLPGYEPGDLIDFRTEDDRVYISMADYFARPLTLTREEALALFVAGRAVIRAGLFDEKGPLASALSRIETLLSETEKEEVGDIARRIDVEMGSYSGRWEQIIDRGLKEGKNLVIDYYSFSRGDVSNREVEPLSLIWSRGYWYLQAWCHEAEDLRLFRLDRIMGLTLTDTPVTMEVSDELHVPELVGEYRPGKKAHHVRLHFPGREGRMLVEEWPTAKVTEGADGSLTLELRTGNLSWLSGYLLRFGDRFTIESPKELKKLVQERASRMLEMYG